MKPNSQAGSQAAGNPGVRCAFRGWLAALSSGSVAALLVGCSAVSVLNAVEPRSHVSITHNIAYEAGAEGSLDVYRPKRQGSTPAPVVVFLYGGSWQTGRKAEYAFVGDALATEGFLTIIPNYRRYPSVVWPTFLQDNAAAVRWAREHAAGLGGDPHNLFLLGHSAGAYDAVMLGLDPRWLAAVGLDPRRDLRGVIGLAGPYDFLPLKSAVLKTIFGPPEGREATQPINYVNGDNPPLFLGTDTADRFVEPSNTTRLAAKVRGQGGPVEVHYYRGLSHALLIGVFAAPLRFLAPVLRDVTAFIHAHAQSDGSGQKPPISP